MTERIPRVPDACPAPRAAPARRRGAGFRYNAAMRSHVGPVVVLLLLLAAFLVIAALPGQVASIRLAGVSLLWWYGGVVAPVLACVVAVLGLADEAPPRRAE